MGICVSQVVSKLSDACKKPCWQRLAVHDQGCECSASASCQYLNDLRHSRLPSQTRTEKCLLGKLPTHRFIVEGIGSTQHYVGGTCVCAKGVLRASVTIDCKFYKATTEWKPILHEERQILRECSSKPQTLNEVNVGRWLEPSASFART